MERLLLVSASGTSPEGHLGQLWPIECRGVCCQESCAGYDKPVSRLAAVQQGLALAVLITARTGSAQLVGPDQIVKGVWFVRPPSGVRYDMPEAQGSLAALKAATNANWVCIAPIWWQPDTGSARIYFLPESSPSDSELRGAIRLARALGLGVFLKPEIRCSAGLGIGRRSLESPNWFDQYRRFILHYARLAQEERCELFSIGYALDSAADDPWEVSQWQGIIDTVRRLYSGRLTYAADWRTYRRIGFWSALDYIGINACVPLYDAGQSRPLPESMTYFSGIWESLWIPQIEAFLDSLGIAGLPVLLTEIGYRSIQGCARAPWDETAAGLYDDWEQRCCYMAALHAFWGKPWFAGWFWNGWTTSNRQAENDLSYSPRNKPAQEVLRRWNASIATHRGACLPAWTDEIYAYPRTYLALCSLVAHNADWVTVHGRWMMRAPGPEYETIMPVAGHSPSNSSIRRAIRWARSLGLKVSLNCYVACLDGRWCNDHNPGDSRQWFQDESVFVTHYAAVAEEESCEMFNFGLEINRTMDSPAEAEHWVQTILPAVRRLYSGPLAYGSITEIIQDSSAAPPDPSFWNALDIVGFDWYAPLFDKREYTHDPAQPERDTAIDQRPSVEDLLEQGEFSWSRRWIPRLESLYRVLKKPLMFTEIGYRSVDSTASWPWQSGFWAWQRLPSGTTADLYSVCFPQDTLTGYVVGARGTICKTTNSGLTWQSIRSGTRSNLYSLDFPVSDTGFAVGEDATIIKFSPAGLSLLAKPLVDADFYGVSFPEDAQTGFVVGCRNTEPSGTGIILKTTDGGRSWAECSWPEGQGAAVRLRSITFLSEGTGYVVGDKGTVLRTGDTGRTWTAQKTGTRLDLYSVDFPTPNTGFAVGESGAFLMTSDGGASWIVQRFREMTGTLFSVDVPEIESARFAAGAGIILRAGRDWSLDGSFQSAPVAGALRSVHFPVNGLVGFVVGDSGRILRTSRGGRMIVDFNEQASCTEATFRAFWQGRSRPRPLPWFYGFHWWMWCTDPWPMVSEHEYQIANHSVQGKPAGTVLREWYRAMAEQGRQR